MYSTLFVVQNEDILLTCDQETTSEMKELNGTGLIRRQHHAILHGPIKCTLDYHATSVPGYVTQVGFYIMHLLTSHWESLLIQI
jgi:hypothetical protein